VSDGAEPSALIRLKARHPQEIIAGLKSKGYREFVLVERMFFPDMKVYRDNEIPKKSDYMSVLYARR
jgi:precorrin-2/cobalt-factor-2 C20-methyltransferase